MDLLKFDTSLVLSVAKTYLMKKVPLVELNQFKFIFLLNQFKFIFLLNQFKFIF